MSLFHYSCKLWAGKRALAEPLSYPRAGFDNPLAQTFGLCQQQRIGIPAHFLVQSLPRDVTHWSTPSMAKECGLGAATVSRIWRAFCLKLHRYETFKLF